jgi:hypothetical protein
MTNETHHGRTWDTRQDKNMWTLEEKGRTFASL